MKKMKAVQVVARGRAEFIETPPPEIQSGHVLVRTSHLSLCGSDIRMLHYAPETAYPFPPGTTGHEMVGVIEAVGDVNSPLRVGDRVLSLAPGHQAMCECYLAPVEHIVPLPQGKPIDVLLQAQQLGTVLFASQRLSNVVGKNIAVIGQGSAGLWFDFHLRRSGARRVVAIDREAFRLERSLAFGATQAINNSVNDPQTALRDQFDGRLADIVIEAAGEVDAINLSVDLVEQYGEILFFGVPRAQTFPFCYDEFFHKCCRATTIVGAAVEKDQISTRIALDWIAAGIAPAEQLITHRFRFENVLEAYEMHHKKADGTVKIVIEMPGAVPV